MDIALKIWGVIGLIMLVLVTIGFIANVWDDVARRIRRHYYRQAREDIANSIDEAAYWFCEDTPTSQLLHNLAAYVKNYDVVHADTLRNTWRNARRNCTPKV